LSNVFICPSNSLNLPVNKYKHILEVLHVPEMAKNLLVFKKSGLNIHVVKEIFIKNKRRNKITNFVVDNGLFKIGQYLIDDRTLAPYLLIKEAKNHI
jgi:hypothetical protein